MVIAQILGLVTQIYMTGFLLFVPSEFNPADALTRYMPFSPVHENVLNWALMNAGASLNLEWAKRILRLWGYGN